MKLRLLSLLLALILVLSLLPFGASAADEENSNSIEYPGIPGLWFDKDSGEITKCKSNALSIEIPQEIDGVVVKSIGERAFDASGVTSLTIPNTVELIGKSAFDGCKSLKNVILQDGTQGLTIESRAFADSGISSIVLPNRTSSIGVSAFMQSDIASVVVSAPLTPLTINANTFYGCENLMTVVLPSSTTLQATPFSGCKKLEVIHCSGTSVPSTWADHLSKNISIHISEVIPKKETKVTCYQVGVNPAIVACSEIDDSCGEVLNFTRYTSKLPHTPKEVPAVPATCTASGLTAGEICEVAECQAVLKKQEYIEPLPHKQDTKLKDDEIIPASCKDGMITHFWKCSACNTEFTTTEILQANGKHLYTKNEFVDESLWTVLKKVSCTEDGSILKARVCDVCGKSQEISEEHIKEHQDGTECDSEDHVEEVVPALGHVKGENWILDPDIKQEYNCADGTGEGTIDVIYQCTRCEEYPKDDPDLKAKIKVPAGEHSYGEPVKLTGEGESKEPTCTEKGKLVTQRTCTVCGTKEGKVTKELDALGHNVTEWTTDKEPTCTEDGKRSGTCENPRCGLKIEEAIEKLGHDFESKDATKEETTAPTCTTEGVMTITCGRKDCGVTTTETIAMIPHTPTAPGNRVEKKAPTCTAEGIAHYDTSCKVCGLDLQDVDVPIPALGHDFGPWTTSGSTRTRTCKREGCGYTETDSSTTPSEPSDPSDPTNPSTPTNTYYSVDVIRPANGSISVSTSSARADTRVTVTLRPNSGYQLDSVWVTRAGSGRNVALSGNGTNRYTFIMPASRVEVRAVFSSVSGSSTSTNTTPPNDRNTNPTKNIVINIPQISSASTPAGSRVFVDVPSTFWAQGEIAWACQRGFISGSGGNFYPNNPITVRQLWMVMARMMGQNPANMEEARVWALNNGFADGGNPNAALTRLQLATMLYRCARLMGSKNTNTTNLGSFSDSRNIPAAAKNAMAWAVANGIITGTTDGRLNPSGTVSRAQFCVILYRYYQRLF